MTAPVFCFDFDGVLAESVSVKTEAFAALYREHGPDIERQVVAHHLANGGMSRFEKFRHYHATFLGHPLDDDGVAALSARFSHLVEEAVTASPWVPGARRLVEDAAAHGTALVVSATPDEELHRILARRGMDGLFSEAHGSSRRKADILMDVQARYGVSGRSVVMIGDAINDFSAAAEGGTLFLGRVPADHPNPFPPGTPVVSDFSAVDAATVLAQAVPAAR